MRAVSPLRPGDPSQLGAYRLLGRIGRGGQGEVYLAETPSGERVAAKLLNADSWADERAQRLFMREVSLAKQVARFCTAQVLDAGMLEAQPYLISEYIDGPSLAERVATGGPLRDGALERLAIGTATALTAIHQAGIVHRDFKPGNVLLGPDGPRVIDFGIARDATTTATVTSQIVGTPAFIAPEQLTGTPASAASDVFAWGVTMAVAATGTPPFGDDSIPAVINRVLHERPETAGVQPPLRELVERCMDKDPGRRPTAQEVLLTLLGGRPSDLAGAASMTRPGGRGGRLGRSAATAAVALLVGGGVGALAAAQSWTGTTTLATSGQVSATGAVRTQPGEGPSTGASRTQPGQVPPTGAARAQAAGASITPTASTAPVLPAVDGLDRTAALARIEAAGLRLGTVTPSCAEGVTPGRVVKATLRSGDVDLVVGARTARVPDARGWPLKDGQAAVEKAGFTVKVGYQSGPDWVGKVAALTPAAGAKACQGTQVELRIGIR
ncbi:serine/threonine protein kinase [Nonomuraea sp. NPDC050663]|uniref:serine/threonine protein kinase n=1 Tax=Nonomuraea sp. NPDC050663 TaxID=3364370 RepID=UPI0037A46952